MNLISISFADQGENEMHTSFNSWGTCETMTLIFQLLPPPWVSYRLMSLSHFTNFPPFWWVTNPSVIFFPIHIYNKALAFVNQLFNCIIYFNYFFSVQCVISEPHPTHFTPQIKQKYETPQRTSPLKKSWFSDKIHALNMDFIGCLHLRLCQFSVLSNFVERLVWSSAPNFLSLHKSQLLPSFSSHQRFTIRLGW